MGRLRWLVALGGVLVALGVTAGLSRNVWLPHVAELLERGEGGEHHEGQASDKHGDEYQHDADREEAGHVEAAAPADGLELSQQGRKNIIVTLLSS